MSTPETINRTDLGAAPSRKGLRRSATTSTIRAKLGATDDLFSSSHLPLSQHDQDEKADRYDYSNRRNDDGCFGLSARDLHLIAICHNC